MVSRYSFNLYFHFPGEVTFLSCLLVIHISFPMICPFIFLCILPLFCVIYKELLFFLLHLICISTHLLSKRDGSAIGWWMASWLGPPGAEEITVLRSGTSPASLDRLVTLFWCKKSHIYFLHNNSTWFFFLG